MEPSPGQTALTRYARLESVGRWRPSPDAPWREVGVAFGSATLTLTSPGGEPVAHWSLPAVRRLNPGEAPARYAPDAEATEALEVDDDLLVDAVERVEASVARALRPRPRPVRVAALGLGLAALVALALWLPGAVRRQALEVVPAAKRTEIGATMLGYLQHDLGLACRDPLGAAALDRLRDRVLGEGAAQAVVLPGGPARALLLPGGIVVLPRAAVEGATEPAGVAEAMLAAVAAQPEPLGPLLDRLGFAGTLRLLASGEPPAEAVEAHAQAIETEPPAAGEAALVQARAAAGLAGGEPPLLLTDGEWVSLQGICRGG